MSHDNGSSIDSPLPGPNSAVARKRRDEIVTAAAEIISTQGLHRLSLAKIERKTGMARGHLTYYFRTKEDILLAVFDRMLARMVEAGIADAIAHGAPPPNSGKAFDALRVKFDRSFGAHPVPPDDGLHALVCTFMAQVRHRDDYREKLAATFAGWRGFLTADIASSVPADAPVRPEVLASVVMALFQGLGGQLAVDPDAFDRTEMAAACLKLLAPMFGRAQPADGRGDP
jgi:AcrR family transcriptional regulator